MNQHIKKAFFMGTILFMGITSCNETTSTTVKEEEKIETMDSTSNKVEENTKKIESQTKKLEESIEKVDKEFEQKN